MTYVGNRAILNLLNMAYAKKEGDILCLDPAKEERFVLCPGYAVLGHRDSSPGILNL